MIWKASSRTSRTSPATAKVGFPGADDGRSASGAGKAIRSGAEVQPATINTKISSARMIAPKLRLQPIADLAGVLTHLIVHLTFD